MINFRENVRGFLFQGRFSSCPVFTGKYLLASIRYIEQNPTKAKLVKHPWKYKWSSAGFHCGEVRKDPLVQKSSLLSDISNWKRFLSESVHKNSQLKEKIRTGRPFGPDNFYSYVEELTGNDPRPGLPGRPKKNYNMSPEFFGILVPVNSGDIIQFSLD